MKLPYVSVDKAFEYFDYLYGERSPEQELRYKDTFKSFCKYFGVSGGYIASSSGRVELLGNHTDHNGGKVLSTTISLDTIAFFVSSKGQKITLYSEGYGEIIVDLNDYTNNKEATPKGLISGVLDYFVKNGKKIGGFKAYCNSNVLGGAGISSSASFEVLIAEILNFLYNDGKVTEEEKALASWYSENNFFGKPCGKLDQTAISFGGVNLLDFSCDNSICVKRVDNNLSSLKLFLINTGGSHENLTDEYASIPNEMKKVASLFGKSKLIEVSENEFLTNLHKVLQNAKDREVSRAIHFYQENARVQKAYEFLNNKDDKGFIDCVNKSGESSVIKLQNCMVNGSSDQPIIKTLSALSMIEECLAIRVHGGGFAGCVLAVVEKAKSNVFSEKAKKIFGEKFVIELNVRSVGAITL